MAGDDAVLEAARRWQRESGGAALATVIATWGSSPRPLGSQLAVSGDGRFLGSVSGGCVEGAVVSLAKEVVAQGAPRRAEFGVSDEEAWSVGLPCGGRIEVYVERAGGPALSASTLARLLGACRGQEPVARVTELASGAESLVAPDGRASGAALSERAYTAAAEALRRDKPALIEDGRLFVRPYNPPARLVIVGATHIAQSLAPMARLAGYGVVIVDPRRAFAAPERFPGFPLLVAWPEEAFAGIGLDGRTAVVTLAHDPKLDDATLKLALAGPSFYVGALGSRRNQEKRRERLRAAGVDEEALKRIHGPVGLAIGALSPAEIAVSILAEITKARRLGEAE